MLSVGTMCPTVLEIQSLLRQYISALWSGAAFEAVTNRQGEQTVIRIPTSNDRHDLAPDGGHLKQLNVS
jgi:hypothetical protein